MKKIVILFFAFLALCSGLARAGDFPATVQYRKALTGPGYVLMINTTIKEDFPALLTVKNSDLGMVRRYEIFLTWRRQNQYGPLEGVTVYGGDEIILENNNYPAGNFHIPR